MERLRKVQTQLQSIDKKMVEVTKLKTGMCFGEAALLNTQPRSASIKCITECHLGTLSKANYEATVASIQKINIIKKVEFIKECP